MTAQQEARAYDNVNLGVETRAISRDTRYVDTANVGVESRVITPEGYYVDTANVGIESIPIIYLDAPQEGWGVTANPFTPLGQISAFSEGRTYDTADVTT